MSTSKPIRRSPYLLWAILAIPSIPMILGVSSGNATAHDLLHPTGEFAARFMIIAMLATPFRLLFPTRKWSAWLVRNRRYFGVAAFAYSLIHTVFYVVDSGTLRAMLDEFLELGIWSGWIAFFIFLPLALTSNDAAVK